MAYPEHWMSELLSKNDIVTVVSSYIELKPKGRRLWGLCPVHGEKTASFSVSPDKQLYYCFGCHIGGSVIQFIMDVEHVSFHEAVEQLANRVGMAMPQEVNDAAMMQERAKRERAVLDYLAAHQPAMRSVIARHVGCRPDTLTHTLRALRDRGLARSVGHLRGARWVLPNWEGA